MRTIEASIDVGTNTMILLVAEIEHTASGRKLVKTLEDRVSYARLGEGVKKNRIFSDAAMKRAKAIFQDYAQTAKKYKATKIYSTATSASRNAMNAKEFYQQVDSEIGIATRIIPGDWEAYLSFIGGILPDQDPCKTAIMDIGGGSTEFVTQNNGKIVGQSTEMGCVAATELFLRGDPYTKESLEQLENHLRSLWKNLNHDLQNELRQKQWVGVAGTATTLAALNLKLDSFISSRVDGHVLDRCSIADWYEALAIQKQYQREREDLIGPGRADIMVAGVLILLTAMEVFEKEEIIVSSRGLRHGVLIRPEVG
ncbi:MAG: hypothetical protein AB7F43_11190 [Bacteriovoracia bacterium]